MAQQKDKTARPVFEWVDQMKIQSASQAGNAEKLAELLADESNGKKTLPRTFAKKEALLAAKSGQAGVLAIWLGELKAQDALGTDPQWARALAANAVTSQKVEAAMAMEDFFGPKWTENLLTTHWNAVLPGNALTERIKVQAEHLVGKTTATRDKNEMMATLAEFGVGSKEAPAAAEPAQKPKKRL